jgi:hypothetical protein
MLEVHSRPRTRSIDVPQHQKPSQAKTDPSSVPVYQLELWTSKQRQANSIHEVSYRACFKPQLPAYFIGQLTHEGDAGSSPTTSIRCRKS